MNPRQAVRIHPSLLLVLPLKIPAQQLRNDLRRPSSLSLPGFTWPALAQLTEAPSTRSLPLPHLLGPVVQQQQVDVAVSGAGHGQGFLDGRQKAWNIV